MAKKIKIPNSCCGLEFSSTKNSKVFIIVWPDCIPEFSLTHSILKANLLGLNLSVSIIAVKRRTREAKSSGTMVKRIIFVVFEIFHNKKSCTSKYDVTFA